MSASFWDQHWSTPLRHQSALRLLARIGLSPTTTKTGLVWEEGRIRSATRRKLLLEISGYSPPGQVIKVQARRETQRDPSDCLIGEKQFRGRNLDGFR